jgi:hypothetical protein
LKTWAARQLPSAPRSENRHKTSLTIWNYPFSDRVVSR